MKLHQKSKILTEIEEPLDTGDQFGRIRSAKWNSQKNVHTTSVLHGHYVHTMSTLKVMDGPLSAVYEKCDIQSNTTTSRSSHHSAASENTIQQQSGILVRAETQIS